MKKVLFTLVLFFMTIASHGQNYKLCDCNHDGQVTIADVMMVVDVVINGYAPFSVSPTEVTMSVGGIATLDIIGGYSLYQAVSANSEVVEASLNGTTVILSAVAGGETTVTVRDIQTFRTIEVSVKVNYSSLGISSSELSLSLDAGAQGTVSITSGSGSYSVQSSDTGVATATVKNGTVTVTAVGAGTATITVTDRGSGATATIEVTVSATPTSYLTCPDDHHPHLIDLGLPSGTKWACCNVDTDHPENQTPTNYGGYYAWGETETKSNYSWSTYTHCEGSQNTCHNLGSDIAGTQYDVAHVMWGVSWVMPSYEQLDELRNNCTSTWTTQNGVIGRLFTGTNGGSIFLPAEGYRFDSTLSYAGSRGYYWSSTQFPSRAYCGYSLYIGSGDTNTYDYSRSRGHSVRPVASSSAMEYQSLALSETSQSLSVAETGRVSITSGSGSYSVQSSDTGVATATVKNCKVTVTAVGAGTASITVTDTKTGQSSVIELTVMFQPFAISITSLSKYVGAQSIVSITSGNGSYSVESSDANVATAAIDGSTLTVTAVGAGTAFITVTDTKSGETATIEVTVKLTCPDDHHPHLIDLGLPSGTMWACCNVDTDHPENQSPTNYGGYYDWNGEGDIAGTRHDVAHVNWGGSWVMPSIDQCNELRNNCTYEWTTVNGVNGGKFTSNTTGGSIFLPTAGSSGNYWSSSEAHSLDPGWAYVLRFNSEGAKTDVYDWNSRLSVRPVAPSGAMED